MGSTFHHLFDDEFIKPSSPYSEPIVEKLDSHDSKSNHPTLGDITCDFARSNKIILDRYGFDSKVSVTQSPLEVMAQRFGEVVKGFHLGSHNLHDHSNSICPKLNDTTTRNYEEPMASTDSRSSTLFHKPSSPSSWNAQLPLFLSNSSLSYFQNCLHDNNKQWNSNLERNMENREDSGLVNSTFSPICSNSTSLSTLLPGNPIEYHSDKELSNDTMPKPEISNSSIISSLCYPTKSSYLSLPSILPLTNVCQHDSVSNRTDSSHLIIQSNLSTDQRSSSVSSTSLSSSSSPKHTTTYSSLAKLRSPALQSNTQHAIHELPSPSLELLRKQTSRLCSSTLPTHEINASHSFTHLTHNSPIKSAFKDQPHTNRISEIGFNQHSNQKSDLFGNSAQSQSFLRSSSPATSCLPTHLSSSTSISQAPTTLNDLNQKTMSYYWSHDCSDSSIKPPFSYITLIVSAMSSKPSKKITLNEIYAWIMSTFAYYRKNTRRWQNSIRHALSFNDCFIKVPRPTGEAGKGSYWTVHPRALDMFDNGSSMRRNRKFIDENRLRHSMGSRKLGLNRLKIEQKLVDKDGSESSISRSKITTGIQSHLHPRSPNVKSEMPSPERIGGNGSYFDDQNIFTSQADINDGSWKTTYWNSQTSNHAPIQNEQSNRTHFESPYLLGYPNHLSEEALCLSPQWITQQSQAHNLQPPHHHHHHHHHPSHFNPTTSPRSFSDYDPTYSNHLKISTDRTPIGTKQPYSFGYDLNSFENQSHHWFLYDQEHKLYV